MGIDAQWSRTLKYPSARWSWENDRFGRAGGCKVELFQTGHSAEKKVPNDPAELLAGNASNHHRLVEARIGASSVIAKGAGERIYNAMLEDGNRTSSCGGCNVERGTFDHPWRRGIRTQLRLPSLGDCLSARITSKVEAVRGSDLRVPSVRRASKGDRD